MTDQQTYPAYGVQDIGPDEAKEILLGNTHNRHLRSRVVNMYADDMRSGAWRENGESIKIAVDGTVLDGQHRLHAIVESQTRHRVLVVTGLPMETQETVDGGAKRKFADVLKLRGEVNCVGLAAAVRRVHLWEAGGRRGLRGGVNPTTTQMLTTLEKYPELRRSVQITALVGTHVPLPTSVLSLCHFLFERLDYEDTEFFFARLRDGVNLDQTDPIYVLRRTVVNANTDRSRLVETQMIALVIKAWNAYREGRSIQVLSFKPGGSSPEKFPEPV